MGDSFRKVRPGDKLAIPARAYNSFIDLVNIKGILPSAGRPGAVPAGTQLTVYEVAQTPDMVTLSGTYKLRDVGNDSWLTATEYALDAIVNNTVDDVEYTYKCILAHTSGASSEPGVGASWETYWEESYSDGYILAPPYSGNIEEYAPLLETGDPVVTMVDADIDPENPTRIWIVSPGFIHIATTTAGVINQYSLWWNTTTKRLMSVFGG